MSIERTIIERLNESRRLDEAFPPVLNKLSKYEKDTVRKALTKANIDIENTPYKSAVITNGRDPRLQGNNVVIFEMSRSTRNVAVWFQGKFLVDVYIYDLNKNVSKMSWKNILEYAIRITVMEFDPLRAGDLIIKKNARAASQKGTINRYTNRNKPRYTQLDKSGYIVDPQKYQKMLANMKINDGPAILKSAKDVYVKLANNLDKIDWDNEFSTFESYDYIMKEIVSTFQSLTKSLKEFEGYSKERPVDSDDNVKWWYNHLKDQVVKDIKDMRELIVKAKKYI